MAKTNNAIWESEFEYVHLQGTMLQLLPQKGKEQGRLIFRMTDKLTVDLSILGERSPRRLCAN